MVKFRRGALGFDFYIKFNKIENKDQEAIYDLNNSTKMDYTDEEFYMLALSLMDEFTAYQKVKMLEEKGSAEAVFLDLGKTELYTHHRRQQIQNVIKHADMECELMAKNNLHAIFAKNIEFPFRLRNCPDYPLVLFHNG